MVAVKLDTITPRSRRPAITVPAEIPVGRAEVIILSKAELQQGNGQALLRYLEQHRLAADHRRSAVELDAQIEAERSAWD